jgi:O-antigen ligase
VKKIGRIEKILFLLLIIFLPAQLGKHFWPQTAFIRGIRIDYLSPTLFITDLIIIAILATRVLSKRKKIKSKVFKKSNTELFGLVALFLVIANVLLTPIPAIAFYNWSRLALLTSLFLYLINATQDKITALFSLLPIPIIYSSLIALTQFIKQASIGGMLYWFGERRFSIATPGIAKTQILGRLVLRPYATFPHPNALAGFILIALALLASSMFSKRKSPQPADKILLLTFILGFLTLLLTFSLSAWIAAALLAIMYFLKKIKIKALPATISILIALGLLISLFPPEEQSINQRLQTAKTAIQMIRKQPLTGVGLGNFIPSLEKLNLGSQLFKSPFLYYQPVHNIYLLIASETGLISFSFFIWFCAKSLKKAKQKSKLNALLALLGIFLIGLVDHYWITLPQTRLLFTIVLALAWRKT